jgi:phospholipase C
MDVSAKIQHVFVLMLENRSFDHLLGFSGITGTDAATGAATKVNGLAGNENNSLDGQTFQVAQGADFAMVVDPGHEFGDVLCQLCGPNATYAKGGAYPQIDNSGFVASYAKVCTAAQQVRPLGEIMNCYTPAQLPVLNALAAEFAVCDVWHASMPGPTWPNRMFVHAGSSAGLDHSPTTAEIVEWETLFGFSFPHGTIFDALNAKGLKHRLYAGDKFPMVSALKGIHLDDIRGYSNFAADTQGDFPFSYVFIEPSYAILNDYKGSTSEHPLDDIRMGEGLIKSTYEAIRNSPLWNSSVLIVIWDEHGGFYDHVPPPVAVAPGDSTPDTPANVNGFTFEQYGPRVPAVVVSPWIPKATIDHRVYDHASVPATLEKLFGMAALTARDAAASDVLSLLSLDVARTDALASLPAPASPVGAEFSLAEAVPVTATPAVPTRPSETIDDGSLPVFVQAALRQDLEMSPASERPQILARVKGLKTRADAAQYLREVEAKRASAS